MRRRSAASILFDKFQFGELNTKLNTEKLTVDTHRHVKSRRSFFIPKISG